MPKECRLMEIARNSLSGCKRWRSSELGWPRLRVVVGQRPKSECHPVREPENARLLPGVKRIFHHLPMFDRICAIPPAYHVLVEENIYIYLSLYLIIYLPNYTNLPTYLSTYRSIYLLPSVKLIVPGLGRGHPWPRGTAPGPSRSSGHRRLWPGRPGLPWQALAWAWPSLPRRRWTCPARGTRGCPTKDIQAEACGGIPFAGDLGGRGWPPARRSLNLKY